MTSAVFWLVRNGDYQHSQLWRWDALSGGAAGTIDQPYTDVDYNASSLRAIGAGHVLCGTGASESQPGYGYSADWTNRYMYAYDSADLTAPPVIINPPAATTGDPKAQDFSTVSQQQGGHYDAQTDTFWISDPYPLDSDTAPLTATYMVLNGDLTFNRWAGLIDPDDIDHQTGYGYPRQTAVVAAGRWLYRRQAGSLLVNRVHMDTDQFQTSGFGGEGTGTGPYWNDGPHWLVGYSATYGVLTMNTTTNYNDAPGQPDRLRLNAHPIVDADWHDISDTTTTRPTPAPGNTWDFGIPFEAGTLGTPEQAIMVGQRTMGNWMAVLDDTTLVLLVRDQVNPVVNNGGAGTEADPEIQTGEQEALWSYDLATTTTTRLFGIPYSYTDDGNVSVETGGAGDYLTVAEIGEPALGQLTADLEAVIGPVGQLFS